MVAEGKFIYRHITIFCPLKMHLPFQRVWWVATEQRTPKEMILEGRCTLQWFWYVLWPWLGDLDPEKSSVTLTPNVGLGKKWFLYIFEVWIKELMTLCAILRHFWIYFCTLGWIKSIFFLIFKKNSPFPRLETLAGFPHRWSHFFTLVSFKMSKNNSTFEDEIKKQNKIYQEKVGRTNWMRVCWWGKIFYVALHQQNGSKNLDWEALFIMDIMVSNTGNQKQIIIFQNKSNLFFKDTYFLKYNFP
jgi:hypothetical protein